MSTMLSLLNWGALQEVGASCNFRGRDESQPCVRESFQGVLSGPQGLQVVPLPPCILKLTDDLSTHLLTQEKKSPSMALVQHACGQVSTSAGFPLGTQPCSLLLWRPPGPSWTQAPTAQCHWLQKTAPCLPSLLAPQVQTSSSLAKSASFSAVQWPIHTFSREIRTPSKFVLLWGSSLSPRVP